MTQQLNISLPKGWQELTEKQLKFISRLFFMKLSETDILTQCFLEFTGIKILNRDPEWIITDTEPDGVQVYWFKNKELGKFWMDVELLSTMIHHLDFLLGEISLFKNPEKIGRYFGCNHMLFGISLEEWILLDQYYIQYAKTQQLNLLDLMLAITYTCKDEKYGEKTDLTKRELRFKKINETEKYIVFIWYTSVKMWLKQKYFYLFDGEGGSAQQSPADYVLGLLSALNEGNVALNPQIKKTSVHEVFYELNKKIERSKTNM